MTAARTHRQAAPIAIIATALSILAAAPASAAGKEYPCQPRAVVDGDTFKVPTKCLPPPPAEQSIRLRGVDTPEKNGKTACERASAKAATAFTAARLKEAVRVILTEVKADKYSNRWDATVILEMKDGSRVSLAELLLNAGHGRPYSGGKRGAWCS